MATATQPQTIADVIAESPTPWNTPSGLPITGEQVAHHIEAASALMATEGWQRSGTTLIWPERPKPAERDNDLEAPAENASVPSMLRWIIRWIRSEFIDDDFDANDYKPLRKTRSSLHALSEVANSDNGDDDTLHSAEKVINLVLRSRTGAPSPRYTAWESRLGRTWPQVEELLAEAAAVARKFGPAA